MARLKEEKVCKHCGSTEFQEGRRVYCSADCRHAANEQRRARPFQNRDSENLPSILPKLQDLSNKEAQELLNESEMILQQIALEEVRESDIQPKICGEEGCDEILGRRNRSGLCRRDYLRLKKREERARA